MGKREITYVNGIDPYTARLIEVARAYYIDNKTQAYIARGLGISRSMVSRYLTAAREMGIVQINIVAPERSPQPLTNILKERYPHLRNVVVVPTFSYDPEALRTMIGRFAANSLMEALQSGQRVALGCGRTLRAMVDALQRPSLTNVTVVQAMGNIGHEAYQIDYNEIARQAADKLGGQAYYVSAPAILGAGSIGAEDLIAVNLGLRHALSLAKSADIFVVGLGSMESDQLYVRSGLVQQHELNELKMRGAVGDICGRFFDIEGREQTSAFDNRILGIHLNDLCRAKLSIGVAGGADKAAPLLGAIRGGFINVVVCDERTLQMLLELDAEKAA